MFRHLFAVTCICFALTGFVHADDEEEPRKKQESESCKKNKDCGICLKCDGACPDDAGGTYKCCVEDKDDDRCSKPKSDGKVQSATKYKSTKALRLKK